MRAGIDRDAELERLRRYETRVDAELERLVRVIAKVAAGDFSEKPELIEQEDAVSRFVSAVRFMIEDLEDARREESEARRTLERLNAELEFKKSLLESQGEAAIDGILVVDPAGHILSHNERFLEIWHLPRDLVEEGDDDAALAMVLARIKDPDAFLRRVRHLYDHPHEVSRDVIELVDGRVLDRYSAPVTSEQGRHLGRVWYFRDVTEERAAAAELAAANERLAALTELKTRFINTAAHELKTPLTPVKVQLHLLREGQLGSLSERQARSLTILERNVDRLTALVTDVLDVARLQSDRLNLNVEPVDLAALAQEAHDSLRDAAGAAGIQLELDAPHPLRAAGDPRRLTQVLYNLVGNAIRFTPRGGRVTIAAAEEDSAAVVRVRDTGVGLTAAAIGELFKPFSQVHDTMQETTGGTGLGLYISRGIMEQHGGTLTCESDGPGKGCTFIMRFPLNSPVRRPPRRDEDGR